MLMNECICWLVIWRYDKQQISSHWCFLVCVSLFQHCNLFFCFKVQHRFDHTAWASADACFHLTFRDIKWFGRENLRRVTAVQTQCPRRVLTLMGFEIMWWEAVASYITAREMCWNWNKWPRQSAHTITLGVIVINTIALPQMAEEESGYILDSYRDAWGGWS